MAEPEQLLKNDYKTRNKPTGVLDFLSLEARDGGIRILTGRNFEGLGFKNSTKDNLEKNANRFLKFLRNDLEVKLTADEEKILFIFYKQVVGKGYVSEDAEEKRIKYLQAYKECSKLAGRKEATSLNTLVKMGADIDILSKDAKKVGYSEFIINNFKKMNVGSKRSLVQERTIAIENARISKEQSDTPFNQLSWEAQEELTEKFAKERDKSRRAQT